MLTHTNLRSGKNIITILESRFVHQTLNCSLKKINQIPISVFVFIGNNSVGVKPGFLTCECQTEGLDEEEEAL